MHWYMHWDLVRQWIGSLGPVVALGAAVVPYRRNSKDRRREQATHLYCGYSPKYELALPGDGFPDGRRETDGVPAFANVTSGKLTDPMMAWALTSPDANVEAINHSLYEYAERVRLDLYSTSDEPFFNVAIWVTDTHGTDKLAAAVGQIEPRGKQRYYAYFDVGTLPATPLDIRLEFQDAAGRSWQRFGTGPVKQCRHLTPTGTTGESPDRIVIPIQSKPDHYSSGRRVMRSMPANEVPALLAGNTGAPDADDTP